MLKRLKAIIKLSKAQKRCYKAHKKIGQAFRGKCKGHYNYKDLRKFPSRQCAACPYFSRGFK